MIFNVHDETIVFCVVDWWKNETMVSPNENEITKK
jgi:hypothetical protein